MTQTSTDFRIDDAAEILECHGITLFMLDRHENVETAWTELEAEHGERIAVAQPRGNALVVSWHYDHKPVAWWIRQAFRTVGMRATWKGEAWDAVHVDLATRRPIGV